jgi:hypothetical protein
MARTDQEQVEIIMTKISHPWHFLAFAILFSSCLAPAWSLTPVTQPLGRNITNYAATGTLADISPTKRTLTISGNEYRYLGALRILSARGENLTVQALSPGQSVAYNVDAGSVPGLRYITEIRILAGPGREH